MPKVLAQLSMNVMDGSKQSPLIARVIQLIASNPHLRYRVHALATDIEGELDDVMEVTRQCILCIGQAHKVHLNLTMMSRPDGSACSITECEEKIAKALTELQ